MLLIWLIWWKNVCAKVALFFNTKTYYATVGGTDTRAIVAIIRPHNNNRYWDLFAQMAYKNYILTMFCKLTGYSFRDEMVESTGNNIGQALMY